MSQITSRDSMRLSEALERLSPARAPGGANASTNSSPHQSWDLNTGYDRAVILAQDGWREKASELEQMMVKIRDLAPQGFRFGRDVSGECVDVGTFLSGEPECMLSVETPPARSISLVVNVSARCSADARLLLNRGIAVASLVYSLQSQSYGVSLRIAEWVSPSSGESTNLHQTMVEVNQPGEYIDPARLAFWLGHPAVLRRCIFRYNEQQPSSLRDRFGFWDSSGYGKPQDAPADLLQKDPDLAGAIVLPFPDTEDLVHYASPENALKRISEISAAQGLQVERLQD